MKIKNGMEEQFRSFVETNSQDFYSRGIVDFAERWASLMEERMAESGEQPSTYFQRDAKNAERAADTEGISGFMYGAAVAALAKFWEHGDSLNHWHNGCYGVGPGATDTVNPALITLSTPASGVQ